MISKIKKTIQVGLLTVGVLLVLLFGVTPSVLKLFITPKSKFTKYNVLIETTVNTPFGLQYKMGSGVVISQDGIILTAGHILKEGIQVRVTLHDGRVFDVNDFYIDDKFDVGYIDLPCDVNEFIELSDPNIVELKDIVTGIGNPWGVFTDVVIKGKVTDIDFRRLSLKQDIDFIKVVLPTEPGFSGGGSYVHGKLIGIMTIRWNKFALIIPSDICKQVLIKWKSIS